MAHQLDFSTGRAGIAIRHDGQTPWHGYGNRLPEDADLDQWRVAAGLDWDVDERAVYYSKRLDERNVPTKIDNRKALVRTDNQACLSVVGAGYNVVQPAEVLGFYRDLIAANGFKLDTAGALSDGRRIWALASTGDSTRIYGQDKVDGYVLLATSYDGTMATTCQFTSVRVVCNNTLQFATENSAGAFKVSHSQKFDAEEAKGALGLSKEAWELYEERVNKLANTVVDLETTLAFFTQVLGNDAVVVNKDSGKIEYSPTFTKLYGAFQSSPGAELRSARGTAWGLVNAVTFYQDHMARGNASGSRLNSAWFGAGASRKSKAFEEALKLAA